MHVALTGAATGIGALVAQRLNQAGHRITAFDITEPQSDCDHFIAVDMSDPESVSAAISAAEGPFDALLNNAGLPPRPGLQEQLLLVNYFGLKQFLDGMLEKLTPGASIVNTASRAGAMWRDNLDEVKALMALERADLASFISDRGIEPARAYNLSKEAVIVMTMAETSHMISRELRMNSVSPAAVSTGILDDFAKAFGDKMTRNVARVGRPGYPEEVADVIVFLLSPQSAWIKGQDIVIDGGMSALALSEQLAL